MRKAIPMVCLVVLVAGCASTPSGQQPTSSMPMAQPDQTPAVSTQTTANPSVTTSPAGQPHIAASPSAQPMAQESVATATTLDGQTQPKALADNQPKKQKLICSTDTMTGSHIPHRTCLTPQQLAAREAQAKAAMDNTLGVTGAAVPNGIFKRNDHPPY
jgi:hypothetical protein